MSPDGYARVSVTVRRSIVLAALALGVVTVLPAVASAALWSLLPTVNPMAEQGDLVSVSCVSIANCTAVSAP